MNIWALIIYIVINRINKYQPEILGKEYVAAAQYQKSKAIR
jgi:hypothetical protein